MMRSFSSMPLARLPSPSFASLLSSATTEDDKGSLFHLDRRDDLSSGMYLMSRRTSLGRCTLICPKNTVGVAFSGHRFTPAEMRGDVICLGVIIVLCRYQP
ncbi:hypothetical protein BGY98DRAFT_972264 [Russula aff. rugulosa BPL654]|nr:hypothetical protein BGY98DRAFT_972264 [Russula aff. rugulosa BPL654]